MQRGRENGDERPGGMKKKKKTQKEKEVFSKFFLPAPTPFPVFCEYRENYDCWMET